MKKPLTAFFAFSADERASVKAENPTFKVGEVAKALGERWASLDPERKAKYESDAEDGERGVRSAALADSFSVQRIVSRTLDQRILIDLQPF